MASSDSSQVSSLPLPPTQYVNLYTDENCKRNRAPRPPPPPQDSYNMFGNQYHADDVIIRPLETQGLKRLYHQNYDHKRELKKLNVSLLVNFLDLLDILIRDPASPKREEKLQDIDLLFIHMHHLINEFRPHQARETLRVTMELQKRQRLEITERFNKQLEKVMEMLNSALSKLTESTELDIKTVVPAEVMDVLLGKEPETESGDPCSSKDRIMCSIVDKIKK